MKTETISIQLAESDEHLAQSADLMYTSDPWVTLKFTEEKCRMAVRGDYKEIYVAQVDGQFAGFAVIQFYGVLRGYIQTLAVMPEMRSKGIGKALILRCEERILLEHPNVFICVSSFNHRAKQLYEAMGYEQIGVLKDYVVRGYDELILRKAGVPYAEYKPANKND